MNSDHPITQSLAGETMTHPLKLDVGHWLDEELTEKLATAVAVVDKNPDWEEAAALVDAIHAELQKRTDRDWPVGTRVEFGDDSKGTVQPQPDLENPRPGDHYVWVVYDEEFVGILDHGYGLGLGRDHPHRFEKVVIRDGWFTTDQLRKAVA
jgi:hypothetical protein